MDINFKCTTIFLLELLNCYVIPVQTALYDSLSQSEVSLIPAEFRTIILQMKRGFGPPTIFQRFFQRIWWTPSMYHDPRRMMNIEAPF